MVGLSWGVTDATLKVVKHCKSTTSALVWKFSQLVLNTSRQTFFLISSGFQDVSFGQVGAEMQKCLVFFF